MKKKYIHWNSLFRFILLILFITSTKTWAQTYHSGYISEDETWELKDSPHIINGMVTINNNATVTIEAGVAVKFEPNQILKVGATTGTSNAAGFLTAVGAVGAQITFSPLEQGTNWWHINVNEGSVATLDGFTLEGALYGLDNNKGTIKALNGTIQNCKNIGIRSTEGTLTVKNSTIDNCEIGVKANTVFPLLENNNFNNNATSGVEISNVAGGALGSNNYYYNNGVGLYCSAVTGLTISGQTFSTQEEGSAIKMHNNCGEFTLTGCEFEKNLWPLTIDIGSFPSESSSLPELGNTNDGIQVFSANLNATSGNIKWFNLGLGFHLTKNAEIKTGGSLFIAPGVKVYMVNDWDSRYLEISGSLAAEGTAENMVTFSSPDGQNNSWYGILFNGNNASIDLTYTNVENSSNGIKTSYLNDDYGNLTLTNCNFNNNSNQHLYLERISPILNGNTFQNSDKGVFISNGFPMLSGNTFKYNEQVNLEIADSDTGGALATNNVFQNSEIGIKARNVENLSISNQTFTSLTGEGAIYLADCGEVEIGAGNSFVENVWPVTCEIGSYLSQSSAGNLPTEGNSNVGLNICGKTTTRTIKWYDIGADYILTDDPKILVGGSLNISDNVNVKLDRNDSFTRILYIYGEITAQATGKGRIKFTHRDSEEYWYAIRLGLGSTGNFKNCDFEYANYAIKARGATVNVENCTFSNILNQPIYAFDGSAVNMLSNEISKVDTGFAVIGTSGTLSGNEITLNLLKKGTGGRFGIILDSLSTDVLVENNTIANADTGIVIKNSLPSKEKAKVGKLTGNTVGFDASGKDGEKVGIYAFNNNDEIEITSNKIINPNIGILINDSQKTNTKAKVGKLTGNTVGFDASGKDELLNRQQRVDHNRLGSKIGIYLSNVDMDSLYHNTIVNAETALIAQNLTSSLHVINNIFYKFLDTGYQVQSENMETLYFFNNDISGVDIYNGTNGTDNINLDPMFKDYLTGDFSLSEGSPCIDYGLDIGLAYFGALPDLGAFEYVTSFLAPHNLEATQVDEVVSLSWDSPQTLSKPLISYNIYRNGQLIKNVTADQTTYNDDSVEHDVTYTYHVTALYELPAGESPASNSVEIHVFFPNDIKEKILPEKTFLYGNYPNPFNPETTIKYSVLKADFCKIIIYNASGQKVRTLVNDYQKTGWYQINWNGKDDNNKSLGSGIYYYQMDMGKYHKIRKAILIK